MKTGAINKFQDLEDLELCRVTGGGPGSELVYNFVYMDLVFSPIFWMAKYNVEVVKAIRGK